MGQVKIAAALALGLALAGCGESEPDQNRTVMRVANPFSDQLKALSEPTRMLGLYRAIRDSGQRCKRVDRGGYQEQYKTMAMWVAHCTDTGDWSVFIAPNGNLQVRQCRHAAQLKLPACKPPPATTETAPPAKKAS